MSQRSERREAERLARKQAYLAAKSQTTAPAATPEACPVISPAQLRANRVNAQLSTGPITVQGKAISSRNNTRHGLAGCMEADSFRVLSTEDQDLYDRNLAAFRDEWRPTTQTEHDLVNRMAMHLWLRLRALHLQEAFFEADPSSMQDLKRFELYRRYETWHERSYNKVLADIIRLRASRVREQNGFESQRRKNEEHAYKIRRLQHEEGRRNTATVSKSTPAQESKTQPLPLNAAACVMEV